MKRDARPGTRAAPGGGTGGKGTGATTSAAATLAVKDANVGEGAGVPAPDNNSIRRMPRENGDSDSDGSDNGADDNGAADDKSDGRGGPGTASLPQPQPNQKKKGRRRNQHCAWAILAVACLTALLYAVDFAEIREAPTGTTTKTKTMTLRGTTAAAKTKATLLQQLQGRFFGGGGGDGARVRADCDEALASEARRFVVRTTHWRGVWERTRSFVPSLSNVDRALQQ
jgi:hypothetical protein